MSEWKEYKLSEVADVQTGPFGSQLHQSDYVFVGTPIITVEHLGDNRIIHQNTPYIGDKDKERLKKYILRKGDIVFSRVGSVDRRAYVSELEDGWLYSGRCLRVRCLSERAVNSKFLSYYFGQQSFKEYIRMIAVGATMPSINTEILAGVELKLPPLSKQKAIADTLSSLDDKIDLLHRNNKSLEAIAETIFRHCFVEGNNTFESGSFSMLLSNVLGGDWGKEKAEGKYTEEVVCIRGTDIGSFIMRIQESMPVRFIKSDKLKKCKLEYGDLVIEISGGSDNQSTGRTMYVNEEYILMFTKPIICSNFCRVLRPKKKEFMYFLYLYLNYLYDCGEFFNLENGTSGIRNLDITSLIDTMKFPLPEKNLILDFNAKIKIIFEKIQFNIMQIRTLESLRDTLLPKLITGEIRVPV